MHQRCFAVAAFRKDEELLRVLHRTSQIGQFLLPIAKGLAAHYAAVLEWVSHITRFALRMLRNTNGIVHCCKGGCFLFSAVGLSRSSLGDGG